MKLGGKEPFPHWHWGRYSAPKTQVGKSLEKVANYFNDISTSKFSKCIFCQKRIHYICAVVMFNFISLIQFCFDNSVINYDLLFDNLTDTDAKCGIVGFTVTN
jgi:hypothetical protein